MTRPSRLIPLAAILTCLLCIPAGAEDYFYVAGLHPDVRPPGAPRIDVFAKDAAWYRRALTGISTPYPFSLRFLESQGAWYTPFIVPGMTGPYDIRNWHPPAPAGGGQGVVRR